MTEHARPSGATDLVPLDEERAVILRLQQGDRSAVATLYGWYGDLVWRQAILPVLPNRELAEDCLREAFRMVLERIDTWNDQGRSIFFWLRMVARNKAMDADPVLPSSTWTTTGAAAAIPRGSRSASPRPPAA